MRKPPVGRGAPRSEARCGWLGVILVHKEAGVVVVDEPKSGASLGVIGPVAE